MLKEGRVRGCLDRRVGGRMQAVMADTVKRMPGLKSSGSGNTVVASAKLTGKAARALAESPESFAASTHE